MSITPTYPGVYLQETVGRSHTITGVPTSITVFIGRSKRGPVNQPMFINRYEAFELLFGGLWFVSTLGYAVRDFYLNGGQQAIIVRLVNGAKPAALQLYCVPGPVPDSKEDGDQDKLHLEAVDAGSWGNSLRVEVTYPSKPKSVIARRLARRYGEEENQRFNLTVKDTKRGVTEQFDNLTVEQNDARRVDQVLASESQLIRVKGTVPANRPDKIKDASFAGGEDGKALIAKDVIGDEAQKTGLYALDQVEIFNLLCIPPFYFMKDEKFYTSELLPTAAAYCEKRRAMLLIDPPVGWTSVEKAKKGIEEIYERTFSKNAAIFFPRLYQPNPLFDDQMQQFAPCGAVAGVFARTDRQQGVWKAAAGVSATLMGVPQLSVPLSDVENGRLNPLGINCLRTRTAVGRIIWGARTLHGNDEFTSEWKYIPVRRLALYIEESLYQGTQWAVFEPNNDSLWAEIRLNTSTFMHDLFRRGAFRGSAPQEAYFIKCDNETTTQRDIDQGIVNVIVGFAPLKPAEFVIINLQQMAGPA